MPRPGRNANSPEIVVIWWRDIPCQVNAQLGRERRQEVLGAKFQRAVDRAKRKAKITTAHEDVAQWRRVSRPCGDDLAAEAAAEAKRLTKDYTIDRLGKLAFRGGYEIDTPLLDQPETPEQATFGEVERREAEPGRRAQRAEGTKDTP